MKIALNGKRRMTPDQLAETVEFINALWQRLDHPLFIVNNRYLDALAALAPDSLPRDLKPQIGHNWTADIAISIGGDGTMLRTARWIGEREIPLLGINSGRLGFMADVSIADSKNVIDDIAERRLTVEKRSLLEVEFSQPPVADPAGVAKFPYALNEVAVLRDETASMISVDTRLDGVALAVYQADGLIVSTPTGSTGYNLSVGGPIMAPTTRCWAISPVAAHSLTMRPLTVPDDSIIDISVGARVDSYRLSLDGRSVTLPLSTKLRLRRAPFVTKVLSSPTRSFADTLRSKLLWGIDGR